MVQRRGLRPGKVSGHLVAGNAVIGERAGVCLQREKGSHAARPKLRHYRQVSQDEKGRRFLYVAIARNYWVLNRIQDLRIQICGQIDDTKDRALWE